MTQPTRQPGVDAAEQALVGRLQAGDRAAFQALVEPSLGSLRALARRLAGDPHWAEDLLQETLIRAYRSAADFRGEARFRSWVLRILVRLAAEPRRWRRGERAPLTPVHAEIPDHLAPEPADAPVRRELRQRIDEAMERLPARQRAALHLRAVEGLDYTEIATALECSRGAARMLVLSARRALHDRLDRYLEP